VPTTPCKQRREQPDHAAPKVTCADLAIGSLHEFPAAAWLLADRASTRVMIGVPLAAFTTVTAHDARDIIARLLALAVLSWWIRRAYHLTPAHSATAGRGPATPR
jgi:hypothetical protein